MSDCIGNDAGNYTLEFNIVAPSPENCGRPLACGVAPNDTALSIPGEVDAYTFAGVAGQQVSLTAAPTSDSISSLRLRLYSPKGDLQSDSCSGTLTFDVPTTGTYTVLVSACITPSTGPYAIVWQTLPACPVVPPAAVAYVTNSSQNTVGVIDLTTNQVVSIIPIPAPQNSSSFSAIVASPNNGFAYATFGGSGTISIINTALNRAVGSINVPVSGSGFRVVLDPEGRYVYAASNVLGGLLVINTATRKVEAVIPVPDMHYGEGSPLAVSPDGKFVYAAASTSQGEPTLAVIDVANRTFVGRVIYPLFGLIPLNVSFNATGTLAYFTDPYAIYVIDTATRTVVNNSLPLEAVADIIFSHDGRVAYVAACRLAAGGGCAGPDFDPAVLVMDAATLSVTNTISLKAALGDGSIAHLGLSPDGGRLLVTNPTGGEGPLTDPGSRQRQPAVVVIDTQTMQVTATVPAVGGSQSDTPLPYDVAVVTPPSGLCTGDDRGQTRVTVGELVSSVNYSVDGCPTAARSRPVATP